MPLIQLNRYRFILKVLTAIYKLETIKKEKVRFVN